MEENNMKNKFIILISSLVLALFSSTSAKSESITLGWAAWDPANALVELSKGFTAETGIDVNFEFVPWPNFADRMLNELNNQGKTFDLLIGDSQWIGGGAVYGHYVKLNDSWLENAKRLGVRMPESYESNENKNEYILKLFTRGHKIS